MKKKLLAAVFLVFSVFTLAACGSHVDLVLDLSGDAPVYQLHLYLEDGERAVLENAAQEAGVKKTAYNPFEGDVTVDGKPVMQLWTPNAPWRVEEYLRALTASVNTGGFCYDETDSVSVKGHRVMIFEMTVSQDSPEWAKSFDSERLWEQTKEIGNNGFIRTFEVTVKNPFAGFRAEYDDSDNSAKAGGFFYGFANGVTAHWTPTTETQTAGQIEAAAQADGWTLVSSAELEGKTDGEGNPAVQYRYERMKMPAFFEAFPLPDAMKDPDNFSTNFMILTLSRFKVAAPAESGRDPQTALRYYYFPSDFSLDAETIRFTYVRPAAAGWLILAMLLGGLAVGIVFAVAGYRKKHPKPEYIPPVPPSGYGYYDTFGRKPLDPFDFDEEKKPGKPSGNPDDPH